MRSSRFRFCLTLGLIGALLSLPPAWAQQAPAGLRLELRAGRDTYRAGDPVELTLTVTNSTADPVVLTAPSSQLYDFAVIQGGREVWRWSAGRMFMALVTPLEIAPGQARVFTEVWDQRDRDGQPVAPGYYVVQGVLIGGEGVGLSPQRVSIRIR